jgi:hypothetical protein
MMWPTCSCITSSASRVAHGSPRGYVMSDSARHSHPGIWGRGRSDRHDLGTILQEPDVEPVLKDRMGGLDQRPSWLLRIEDPNRGVYASMVVGVGELRQGAESVLRSPMNVGRCRAASPQ